VDGQHPPGTIEHRYVDRKSHPHRVNRSTWRQQDPIPWQQGTPELKPAQSVPKSIGDHQTLDDNPPFIANFQLPAVHRSPHSPGQNKPLSQPVPV
jgi:hypothetical protein